MKRTLYIGLNGYAGSGKDTVAKMISHILNYSFSDKESAWDSFKRSFNPEETATFPPNMLSNKCMCIAFADQLKDICSDMFQVPVEYFYTSKSSSWICINKGFEFTKDKPERSHILSAKDYYVGIDMYQNSNDKYYMSLREILVYVGTYVLQASISKNIFLNVVEKKIKQRTGLEYTICTDVRFIHEFDFIRKHNGVMINITRDGIQQLDNVAEHDLDEEDDFDFTIENNSDYESLFYQVWEMIHSNIIFKNISVSLSSHDGSDNYMILREDKNKYRGYVWQLISEYGTSRVGHDNGNIIYVDPSGGPMINVGDYLNHISNISNILNEYHKISKIYWDTETGYLIVETIKE